MTSSNSSSSTSCPSRSRISFTISSLMAPLPSLSKILNASRRTTGKKCCTSCSQTTVMTYFWADHGWVWLCLQFLATSVSELGGTSSMPADYETLASKNDKIMKKITGFAGDLGFGGSTGSAGGASTGGASPSAAGVSAGGASASAILNRFLRKCHYDWVEFDGGD